MPTSARPARSYSHAHAGGPAAAKPNRYNPSRLEHTLLYPTITEHFETWCVLGSASHFDRQDHPRTLKFFNRQVFRKFLECGIFAQNLQTHGPGALSVDEVALHIDVIAFIHRFGASLNKHVHF